MYSRGRRGRGARFQANQSGERSFITRRINEVTRGHTYQPSMLPPLFSLQPWNAATVRFVAIVTAAQELFLTIAAKDVYDKMINQLGLYYFNTQAYPISVEWRLQAYSAWSKAEKGFLRTLPMDFIRADKPSELTNVDSMTQKNMYAAVGYQYPVAHTNHVLTTDSTPVLLIDAPTGKEVEIHFKVLWRGANTVNYSLAYVPSLIVKDEEFQRRGRSDVSSCASDICLVDDVIKLEIGAKDT